MKNAISSYFIASLASVILAVQSLADARLNTMEQWVLDKVIENKEANLKEYFTTEREPKDTVLSSELIGDLLNWNGQIGTSTKISAPNTIRISNAIIIGNLDLSSDTLTSQVVFHNCRFLGSLDLRGSSWASDLVFSSCEFLGTIDISFVTVSGVFGIPNSTFHKSTDFHFSVF